MAIELWLKQKLDTFALRVRASKTTLSGVQMGTDLHYCAGWADGYKAARRDAVKAWRAPLGSQASGGSEHG